jgi:hypothetical protein
MGVNVFIEQVRALDEYVNGLAVLNSAVVRFGHRAFPVFLVYN